MQALEREKDMTSRQGKDDEQARAKFEAGLPGVKQNAAKGAHLFAICF